MKILIDAQLPPSLVRVLADAGHQALHVRDVGLRTASDRVIWDYAVREAAVIFTKDEDFAIRRLHASVGPTIVWVRFGNCSTETLHRRLTPLLPEVERMIAGGEAVIEVR